MKENIEIKIENVAAAAYKAIHASNINECVKRLVCDMDSEPVKTLNIDGTTFEGKALDIAIMFSIDCVMKDVVINGKMVRAEEMMNLAIVVVDEDVFIAKKRYDAVPGETEVDTLYCNEEYERVNVSQITEEYISC